MEDDCRLAVQATEANAAGTNHSRAIVPMRQGGDVPNVKAVERAERRRREAWREAWAPDDVVETSREVVVQQIVECAPPPRTTLLARRASHRARATPWHIPGGALGGRGAASGECGGAERA